MDIKRYMDTENERPLDNMVESGGFCGIFRTLCCIGDSLSSGEFESLQNGKKGYHDYFDYSWGQYIARDAGLTVYNFSRGGLAAKSFLEEADERGWSDPAKAAQAYIIALGVNDIYAMLEGHLTLGSAADIDPDDCENNKPTFAGDYAKIIAKFKAMQPKAKFFLVTCPKEPGNSAFQAMCDKHAALLCDVAALFENCYLIDLRRYAPVYDEAFHRHFYLGGHLNAAGYRLTALMIESYIDYIIRHNPEDFTQIGFVGTSHHNEGAKW